MDFGGRTEVGGERTTYYVPEDNTMHHLDNDLHTETSTVVIWHIPHTINCKRIFSSLLNGHTEMACNFSIF